MFSRLWPKLDRILSARQHDYVIRRLASMPLHPSRLVAPDANSPEPGVLRVRVNDELVLDAGTWESVGPGGTEIIVHPPKVTLFHQLLAYLRSKPDPAPWSTWVPRYRDGLAAAAL